MFPKLASTCHFCMPMLYLSFLYAHALFVTRATVSFVGIDYVLLVNCTRIRVFLACRGGRLASKNM